MYTPRGILGIFVNLQYAKPEYLSDITQSHVMTLSKYFYTYVLKAFRGYKYCIQKAEICINSYMIFNYLSMIYRNVIHKLPNRCGVEITRVVYDSIYCVVNLNFGKCVINKK